MVENKALANQKQKSLEEIRLIKLSFTNFKKMHY
jgi:hypothetical protein